MADRDLTTEPGTTVTATADGDTQTATIRDNYVLICDGTAYVASTQVHRKDDGTVTHVITVKGCRQ